GVRAPSDIAAIVNAVAPKPVNVLVGGDYLTVAQLADLGVRRISVGGALARAAWTGFLIAAKEIAAQGTFTGIGRGISVPEMNNLFGTSGRHGAG
ncbi:MAG TPA: isocitrate lyase/phosphoenolpyruvate mutase family protein, partial [Vicinamibacterales bacterium]|nr:isocitrate lyase/phosphoenolpyruvate mutase family protein [Vicinamibacterales bacterium]